MPYQVLCLSGGGYRGLYTAEVLAGIERETGIPLWRQFDLIAGTSIGGIIALGLAAGVSAVEIARAFREGGSAIFSDRPAPQGAISKFRELLKSACRARYRTQPLARVVTRLVGNELKIGKLKQRVMVPSVNMTKGRPQIFKTPHHPSFVRDRHLAVVDVALATTAAPTYFPLHRIAGEMFSDGGLYCNAPVREDCNDRLRAGKSFVRRRRGMKMKGDDDPVAALLFRCGNPGLSRNRIRVRAYTERQRISYPACRRAHARYRPVKSAWRSRRQLN